MTDLDPMIANLVATSVDAELGAPRPAPAFRAAERAEVGAIARWRAPAFAAAGVLMLTVGVISAIHHGARPVSTPVAPATHAVPAPSLTSALKPNGVIVDAYPEATGVRGVSIGPVPASDARIDGGIFVGGADLPAVLVAGRPYRIRLEYISTLADKASQVLSASTSGFESASCPAAFQARRGHRYAVECTVTMAAHSHGTVTLKASDESGYSSGTWPLHTR